MHVPRVLPSEIVLKVFIGKDVVLLPLASLFFINVTAFWYCQPFWVKKTETRMFLSVPQSRYFHTAVLVLIGVTNEWFGQLKESSSKVLAKVI